MSGRHSSFSGPGSERESSILSACDADRCLHCGRRPPESLSREELADSAQSWRRFEVAAAGLRLVTDSRQGCVTPQWVLDLAAEKPGTPLQAGWEAHEIRRLEEAAREACTCRCHGPVTDSDAGRRHGSIWRSCRPPLSSRPPWTGAGAGPNRLNG